MGCRVAPSAAEARVLVLRSSELQLVLSADLREPIEAKFIATMGFEAPSEAVPQYLSDGHLLSFHASAVIKKVGDSDGNPLALKELFSTRDEKHRLMSLDLDSASVSHTKRRSRCRLLPVGTMR